MLDNSSLQVADEYQEVADLLLRHATLSATNSDLKDHQRKCSELAEKVRPARFILCVAGIACVMAKRCPYPFCPVPLASWALHGSASPLVA